MERQIRVAHVVAAFEDLAALTSLDASASPEAIELAELIELADIIVLLASDHSSEANQTLRIAPALNPRAKLYSAASFTAEQLFEASNPFDFGAAAKGAAWRDLIDEDSPQLAPVDGISSFVFRARRPFHPERLWQTLQQPLRSVFRAKGFIWLASRMETVGGLNVAGRLRQVVPVGGWFAAQPTASALTAPPEIQRHWRDPFGDRRQAIAFFATADVAEEITTRFEQCLLTRKEMAAGEEAWRSYPDPFPEWREQNEHHCCEHHGHAHSDDEENDHHHCDCHLHH
jgi:G3E family GTPase